MASPGPRLLRVEAGVLRAEFPVEDGAIAGRAPEATIRLLDPSVSREHARFYRAGPDWRIQDLGSRNGVWVNGRRVGSEILKPGDEIRLGGVELVFSDPGAAPRETVAVAGEVPVAAEGFPAAGEEEPGPEDLPAPDATAARVLRRALRIPGVRRAALLARAPGASDFGIRKVLDESGGASWDGVLDGGLLARAMSGEDPVRAGDATLLPLRAGGRRIGVLVLWTAARSAGLGEDALRRARELAESGAERLLAAMRISRSEAELESERDRHEEEFIGDSPAVRSVLEIVDRAAESEATVLIQGETGTGKELIARRIHARSPRAQGPFVAVNCAAVAPGLFESELFGHERGAFTGAVRTKPGRLELASGGTLFLDEVAELPAEAQGKLLRALQERVVERVGGTESIRIDDRFVAATNRDLATEVREGRFRRDLFYRLSVVTVQLPPLRERREDIPRLAEHFLRRFSRALGKKELAGFEEDALEALRRYDWPGNVRELANVIHRAVVLGHGARIRRADLGAEVLGPPPPPAAVTDSFSLRDVEAAAVERALRRSGWKKGEAARLLGISLPTLNKKIALYGLRPDSDRKNL